MDLFLKDTIIPCDVALLVRTEDTHRETLYLLKTRRFTYPDFSCFKLAKASSALRIKDDWSI